MPIRTALGLNKIAQESYETESIRIFAKRKLMFMLAQ
jgi:hypothetical protein